jgi:hypothetical protein
MKTTAFKITLLLATGILAASAHAQQAEKAKLPPLLPRDKEIALAMSAAPADVSSNAAIYVLEERGYVKAREGTNGFTCLVSHDAPESIEPECYDAEGTQTHLPRVLRVAELRAQGRTKAQIDAEIAGGFASGKFRAPRRPGIVYMLSTENKVVADEATGRIVSSPPHLMFYAPYMMNADIGVTSFSGVKVFIIREGTPHALMIVPVPMGGEAHH